MVEYSELLCKGKEKPQSYDDIWQKGRPPPTEVATICHAAIATMPGFPELA
jgi:hypothetical protein